MEWSESGLFDLIAADWTPVPLAYFSFLDHMISPFLTVGKRLHPPEAFVVIQSDLGKVFTARTVLHEDLGNLRKVIN